MKTIGKKIRLLRHQKGWSQEDVAKKLEISIPALSKIETGVTDINLSRLAQIAELFEISVIQLLGKDQNGSVQQHDSELDQVNKTLVERENDVITLQQKVIELFEAIRENKSTA